jgi:hypothetical protein
MQVKSIGAMAAFADIPVAGFFAFRSAGRKVFGLKLAATGAEDARRILVFSSTARFSTPHVLDSQMFPDFVYAIPGVISLGPAPDEVRDGVMNPSAGDLLIVKNSMMICARDAEQHDHDLVLFDVITGNFAGKSTEGLTAVFKSWRVSVSRGTEEVEVMSFPLLEQ